jgi:hypothetical protein
VFLCVEEFADGVPEAVRDYCLVLLQVEVFRPFLDGGLALVLALALGEAAHDVADDTGELDGGGQWGEWLVEGGGRFAVLDFVDVGAGGVVGGLWGGDEEGGFNFLHLMVIRDYGVVVVVVGYEEKIFADRVKFYKEQ